MRCWSPGLGVPLSLRLSIATITIATPITIVTVLGCAQVRRAEAAKLQDAPPGSVDDHERLVLGAPNSSRLWVGYMAFLLSMAEVSKAREVAERALAKIDYRCAPEQHS